MKSFHNPGRTQAVAAWQPAEFQIIETDNAMVKPEEILAIFHNDSHVPSGISTPGLKKLKPAYANPCWMPDELPPFTTTVQDFQPKAVDFPGMSDQFEHRRINDLPLTHAMRERVNQLFEEAHNSRTEALRIMDDAKQQAHEIIQQATAEAEHRLQQAYEIGKSQAEAELASLVEAAKEIVTQTGNWQAEMLAQSEPAVIGMVKEISAALFGEGLVLDQKVMEEIFARALMKARAMGSLRIFVNPQDAAQLDADWRDFQVSISGQRIQIVPTDSIHPGGCFIEGDHGAVDARIETRLGAVMKIFENQPEE